VISGAGAFTFNNLQATTNPNSGQGFERLETGLGFNEIRKDVWFVWTAPRNAHVELTSEPVFGGLTVPKIAVYDGAGCPPRESSILDAQHDPIGESSIRFDAVEGRDYLIQIGSGSPAGGQGTELGVFDITLSDPTGACCDGNDPATARETTKGACQGDYLGDFVRAVTYRSEVGNVKLEDIRGFGRALDPFGFSEVPIGFDFPFFGEHRSTAVISPKGYITLAGRPDREDTFASIIPDVRAPDALIAPARSNWTAADGPEVEPGEVHAAIVGKPGSERFIVQWTSMSSPIFRGDPMGDNTWQAVLFQDGSIEFRYQRIELGPFSASLRGRLVAGIEDDDGRRHLNLSRSLIASGLSVRITPDLACDTCLADCDRSGELNIFDFLCFQDAFVRGDPSADCDGSGALNVFDFLCVQDAFAAGCK
jgi:hypothetical protein